jgi:hypothetical protein
MNREHSYDGQTGNLGKWDGWYSRLSPTGEVMVYGDTVSYLMAAAFLCDVDVVEDWGCGGGGFRKFCLTKYWGLDGSNTPFADKVVDLCTYKSNAPGILVRHVLEHNYDWEKILSSAIQSFQRKLCLILFTPFAEQTAAIVHDRKIEIDVPDLSFRREDIEAHFEGLAWRLVTLDKPHALYRVEHLYFVWRE